MIVRVKSCGGCNANYDRAASDVYMFAGITGDFNPAHLDEISAGKTKFKHRIAHGMLSAGLISAVIGMNLPGPGTIYMGQRTPLPCSVKRGAVSSGCAARTRVPGGGRSSFRGQY
ncbi:MAG: MaoC family dehydratase [Synergistaceae bacterium]|nr:MaoC family dehydratase [Synergistaceae bacterium]